MNRIVNPFIVYGYVSPEYFCDRKEETSKLISALRNGRNVTLMSPRRQIHGIVVEATSVLK